MLFFYFFRFYNHSAIVATILFCIFAVINTQSHKIMKHIHLFMSACAAISILATSCKTTQTITNSQQEVTTTTQPATIHLKSLPIELFNGEWLFTQALDKDVIGDDPVRIIFDIASHRIYGNNGCNTFNGTLHMSDKCAIRFTDCMSTTMACRPEVTDNNVMQALNETRYYNVIENSHKAIIVELLNENYQQVALVGRQMREMLNGMWEVAEINGKRIHLDEKPSMILDIETCMLSGKSGCNIMNGTIVYDNTTLNNSIQFTGVATTRRMCAPEAMKVEDKMLDALNKIDSFSILDNKRVKLFSSKDEHTNIVITKAQKKK